MTKLALVAVVALAGEAMGLSVQTMLAPEEATAIVHVIVFDTKGGFIGSPVVDRFEAYDGRNLASRYQQGVAEGIPFGKYRITVHVEGFASGERQVNVFQNRTTVVLGLTPGEIINWSSGVPPGQFSLHGRVVGSSLPNRSKSFVKLTGIYSDLTLEAAIGFDGDFEMSRVPTGVYLLLLVSEQGILATRVIDMVADIPNDGSPLLLEMGRDPAIPRR